MSCLTEVSSCLKLDTEDCHLPKELLRKRPSMNAMNTRRYFVNSSRLVVSNNWAYGTPNSTSRTIVYAVNRTHGTTIHTRHWKTMDGVLERNMPQVTNRSLL